MKVYLYGNFGTNFSSDDPVEPKITHHKPDAFYTLTREMAETQKQKVEVRFPEYRWTVVPQPHDSGTKYRIEGEKQ